MSPVSVNTYTEHGWPQFKQSKIQTRTSSGYQGSGASFMPGSGESFPPNIQGSGDNSTCLPNILPDSFVVQRSVPVHGITQLGLRSHPIQMLTHEALTMTLHSLGLTNRFTPPCRSDPFSPCHHTQAMAVSIVSHIRNPYPAFPGEVHDIHGCLSVIVDRLSRLNQPITTELSLHSEIVKQIFGTWGTPAVDMFATVHNTHLPQFMSPVPEPQALTIDALYQDWHRQLMFMFPLFPLLSKVIQKLRTTQEGEVILVAAW